VRFRRDGDVALVHERFLRAHVASHDLAEADLAAAALALHGDHREKLRAARVQGVELQHNAMIGLAAYPGQTLRLLLDPDQALVRLEVENRVRVGLLCG
jgi:hypothetical protein